MTNPQTLVFNADTVDFAEGKRTLTWLCGDLTAPQITVMVLGRKMNIASPANKFLIELGIEEDSHKISADIENGMLIIEIPFRAEYLSMRRAIPVGQP